MFKNFLRFFMYVVLATTACAFTSCKDDDEPKPSQQTTSNSIVGVWKCVDSVGDSATLTINSDHTGSIKVTIDPSRATVTLIEYFNWNVSDDSDANHWFEIIHTGGDYWFEYTNNMYILAGNTLQMGGFVYTRQ